MNVKTLTNVIKNETAAFQDLSSYFSNCVLRLAIHAIGDDHGGEASFIEIRHRLHLIGAIESELGVYDNSIKESLIELCKKGYLRETLTGYKLGTTLSTKNYTVKAGSFVVDNEEDLQDA